MSKHKKQAMTEKLDIRLTSDTKEKLEKLAKENAEKSGRKVKKGEIARKIIENYLNSQDLIQ